MNRTLRRPMFRRGGSANSGITSGLDTPRQGYKEPGMVQQDDLQRAVFQTAEDMKNPDLLAAYKPYMERPKGEAMNRFLTSFGLDLMSRPSAGSGFGGLLSTAAQSAKGPTDQLFKDIDSRRLNKNAAEADLFKTLLQGKIDIMGEAAGNEAGSGKTYEKLKIAAALREIMPRFLELKEKGNYKLPIVGVSFCKVKQNEHEVDEFIKFWQSKVDLISIQKFMPPTTNKEKYKKYYATDQYNEKPVSEFKCVQPFQRFVFRNEFMYPCCVSFNKDLKLGSIKDTKIYDAWHSPKMNEIREMHKNGKFYEMKTCKDCVNLIYPPSEKSKSSTQKEA